MTNRLTALVVAMMFFLTPSLRAAEKIDFTEQTLPNGLRVIYAPLRQAPVVHVRVLYHVGSRDERADRQGFAHMFEHMMFRGSAHVKPEEHMRLIQTVGGYSNAFTSFDQTVYVDTVPSNNLALALWLEADRMASFKVSDRIYQVERNVVHEEWRRRQNQPYGTSFEDFLRLMYKVHPYRWTPIGNMEDLAKAKAPELQAFFNTYYVPNNAVLVIAGDIDVPAAQEMVKKYFAWIPRGADIQRRIPAEPKQETERQEAVKRPVPLARVMIGWKTPAYKSDDNYALSLLASVLGQGDSSRLDKLLVSSASPLCVSAGAFEYTLQDSGIFAVTGTVLSGKSAQDVEKALRGAVQEIIQKGVAADELEKARRMARVDFVQSLETAEKVATVLGEEQLFAGNAARANEMLAKLDAVTPADVQAVAKKYLEQPESSMLVIEPAPGAGLGNVPPEKAPPADQVTPMSPERAVVFPAGYPDQPPINREPLKAHFARGVESQMDGATVIIMSDMRLPEVNFTLALRRGSHSEPAGMEGLAGLTAELVRHGAGGRSYEQLNNELDGRGITLSVRDGGDMTRLSGSCLAEDAETAFDRASDILRRPDFPADEFARVKQQRLSELKLQMSRPETAAMEELGRDLYGNSPLGRFATPATVQSISPDDVKAFWKRTYDPAQAVLVIAGAVSEERGRELAGRILDGWKSSALQPVVYDLPSPQQKLKIVLIDRPDGRQAMIRMAARAYTVRSSEKFAGSLTSGILSAGIDARLGKYVRAEKGLVYSVRGVFQPEREAGWFFGLAETKLATAGECVEAMFTVFDRLAANGATDKELSDAKLRSTGSLVMGMQTIQQQARYRLEGVLNGYPADYYDRYPDRIDAVTLPEVRDVTRKYIRPDRMTVVVVAPKEAVLDQLKKLGEVEVKPMPGGAIR